MDNGLTIKKVSYDIYDIPINDISEIMNLFKALVKGLELNPHGNAFWQFPTPWNTGGVGITAVQSFTESYIAIDTWPEKKYANLFICSCKYFNHEAVKIIIKELILHSYVTCEILSEVKL